MAQAGVRGASDENHTTIIYQFILLSLSLSLSFSISQHFEEILNIWQSSLGVCDKSRVVFNGFRDRAYCVGCHDDARDICDDSVCVMFNVLGSKFDGTVLRQDKEQLGSNAVAPMRWTSVVWMDVYGQTRKYIGAVCCQRRRICGGVIWPRLGSGTAAPMP